MKKLVAIVGCVLSMSAFGITEKATKEFNNMLTTGDYQEMRNVAYSMQTGTYGYDENPIMACAIRKAILLTYPNKVADSDYSNEYVTCAKIRADENKKAWEMTINLLTIIPTQE